MHTPQGGSLICTQSARKGRGTAQPSASVDALQTTRNLATRLEMSFLPMSRIVLPPSEQASLGAHSPCSPSPRFAFSSDEAIGAALDSYTQGSRNPSH